MLECIVVACVNYELQNRRCFMNNMSIAMGKRQLVDSIWKSAGIEGLGTTFPNTEKILSNLPVQTRRDEVLFIVNMKRAWYFCLII